MVNNLPEPRIDWISRLTKEIDEGTYHVSSKMIAEAIIQKNLHARLR
jgi:anti-sigma28 factor (negative regulator of flagellin synthesis)